MRSLHVAGVSEALATIRQRPLRALLAATAMAAAVATTAIVQTTLDGLARAARAASARAFGSDSFAIAKVATGNVSRRELAQRLERNLEIPRADVRFLETVATDRVMYAATAQRSADVVASGRRFENAAINGTQAALFDIRDVGLDMGRPFTRAEEIGAVPVIVRRRDWNIQTGDVYFSRFWICGAGGGIWTTGLARSRPPEKRDALDARG